MPRVLTRFGGLFVVANAVILGYALNGMFGAAAAVVFLVGYLLALGALLHRLGGNRNKEAPPVKKP